MRPAFVYIYTLDVIINLTSNLMSLILQKVAILSGGDEELQEVAFQYGRNVGIAFQLVDDMLDFVGSSSTLGKPAAADLKLGMATAPVLFAAGKVSFVVADSRVFFTS